MPREPRTAEYLVKHGVQDFGCDGLELTNLEMMRLVESATAEQAHVRDHGECSHGCCDAERITHRGELICRWTRRPCPQRKKPSAGVADVLAEFSEMGDDNNGDSDESGTE